MSRRATLRRLGAAAATLSLLAGTALAAGPAAAQDNAAQDNGGDEASGLHWGIKQSWRNYMNAFGGTITPSGGAVLDPDPELSVPKPYVWPEESSTFDPATGEGTVEFGGAVSFSMPAHFIWDFTFAEPAVTFEGDGTGTLSGTLSYAFYGTRDNPEQVQEPTEVVFADLTFDGAPAGEDATLAATVSSAVLTEEGAEAFAGFYEPGAELDAGALTFAAPDGEPPAQGEPAVTVTPSKGLDPDGAEVTIKGTGFDPAGNEGNGYRLRVGPGLEGLKDPGAGGAYQIDDVIPVADDGTWTLTRTVKAAYTGADGVARTAKETPFSVYTFAWESRDTTWDTTTPLTFGTSPEGPGGGNGNGDGDKDDDPAPSCVLAPGDVAKGDLLWGLKKSFRNYVGVGIGGARGNSITAEDGAVITDIDEVVRDGRPNPAGVPTGAYRFAFGSADYRSADEFTVSYRGTVTFAYPSHFFTFVLGDPEVVVEGGTGTLRADVELRAEEGAPSESVNLPDVTLAELDLAGAEVRDEGGALAIENVAATLASDEAFAGFYAAGTELDPVSLRLGAECAQLPGGNGGNTGGVGAGGGAGGDNLVPSVQFRPQAGANGLAQTGIGALPIYAGLSLLAGGIALTLLARRRAGASDT
ncbi:HtaA domain-containing protein [Saccharomonospora sp. NPDC006951]